MKLDQSHSMVIADDHPILLRGLVELFSSEPDIRVVSSCSDGINALDAIRQLRPDIALLDISMPGLNGLDVLGAIQAEQLDTHVIFLTATVNDSSIVKAITRGAKGLLLKDTAADELLRSIREIAAGGRCFQADLVDAAVARENGRQATTERLKECLSKREREIMLLVAEGLSNKEVGRRLNLAEGTVKIHLHNIFNKVGVSNRTVLTALALAHKDQLL